MSGVNFNVTTAFNGKKVEAQLLAKTKKTQAALDAMILQDSNYFIPVKTSTMEKSSIINSQIGKGVLIWRTPYAKAQYYGDNLDHSKQLNPNACARWFEAAKARWLDKWVRFTNEYFKRS
ncbi:MAG: minor capsid protein [Bacteroidales bacterium]|nr:minor capsid protein [Bacteroidales bacterium]